MSTRTSKRVSAADEWRANPCSRLTFWWVNGLIASGAKQPLQHEDLGDLDDCDLANNLTQKLETRIAQRKNKTQWSLVKAYGLAFGRIMVYAGIGKLMGDLLGFLQPIALSRIINYTIDENNDVETDFWGLPYGYWWAGIMFLSSVFQNLGLHQHHHFAIRAGMHAKAATANSIFRKSLSLSVASRQKVGAGEIQNLQSTDAMKIMFTFYFIHYSWAAPIQIIIAVLLLVNELGVSALIGVAVMAAAFPLQARITRSIQRIDTKTMKFQDSRVKLVNELIQGIRVIKYYAWERFFVSRIERARQEELAQKRKVAIIHGVNQTFIDATPLIVSLLTFLTYGYIQDDRLTASKAFTALSLFNILRLPLMVMPMLSESLGSAWVSFRRVNSFLNLEDMTDYVKVKAAGAAGGSANSVIRVQDGDFSWGADANEKKELASKDQTSATENTGSATESKAELLAGKQNVTVASPNKGGIDTEQSAPFSLRNINLDVRAGSVVSIVGLVGAGKSSLLSAILGEMQLNRGEVELTLPVQHDSTKMQVSMELVANAEYDAYGVPIIKSHIAYCAQQPWVINGTVKENIVFGLPFDAARYEAAIEKSALTADLEVLPGGDQAEIGERGLNLSGGQKARVSIARAIYSDASVILLDDVLSAVDAHVGHHIFTHAIRPQTPAAPTGDWRFEPCFAGRTVLFVSHQLKFVGHTDHVVLMHDGHIVTEGSFASVRELFEAVPADAIPEDAVVGLPGSPDAANAGARTVSTSTAPGDADASSPTRSRQQSSCGVNVTLPNGAVAPAELVRLVQMMTEMSLNYDPTAEAEAVAVAEAEAEADAEAGVAAEAEAQAKVEGATEVAAVELTDASAAKSVDADATAAEATAKRTAEGKLTQKEDREEGTVAPTVYMGYVRALSIAAACLIGFVLLLTNGAKITTDWWLARWSADTFDETTNYYVMVYGILTGAGIVTIMVHEVVWAFAAVRAARILHRSMLGRIVHAPSSFFDTTPLGRILNRFSGDIQHVDKDLPRALSGFCKILLLVVATVIVQAVLFPWAIVGFVPIIILYIMIQQYYRKTSREIKRLDSISRSPVFIQLAEALTGLSTLRAFDLQERSRQRMELNIDTNNQAFWKGNVINRWLGVRLDLIGALLIFVTALVAVITAGTVDPGLAGLSLTYALLITGLLNWVVRQFTETETFMASVERIQHFCEIKTEAAPIIEDNRPAQEWPSAGRVVARNLSIRYRPELPLVLRDVNFEVLPGEHVGVVGRTGSGKSTLMLALFRIVEAAGGTVEIDGQDISQIGLEDLRSKLAIIPQDPVVFSGTMRYNLDPTEQYTDAELWRALAKVELKAVVERMDGGLDGEVLEGGDNFSVGQRQLICLARAVLRQAKVLVMDEATASIDTATDEIIQRMIREEFQSCTVLTIAHRINTIADSDKIIVLERGELKEMGSPQELLATPGSLYKALVERSQRQEENGAEDVAPEDGPAE